MRQRKGKERICFAKPQIRPLEWAGEKRIAIAFTFDVDAIAGMLSLDKRNRLRPSILSMGAYGPLVGIPRILRLLNDYDIKATFFMPGLNAEIFPESLHEIIGRGHEIGHHGYLHKRLDTLSASAEEEELIRGLEALKQYGGVTPVGYRAPWWELTPRTFRLLAKHGFRYDSSLMAADSPYFVGNHEPLLVELPVSYVLDDWEQFAYVPTPQLGCVIENTEKVYELWREEYDAMVEEGGCLLMLTLHPWLIGRASRIRLLRKFLDYIVAKNNAWITTAQAIADYSFSRLRITQ